MSSAWSDYAAEWCVDFEFTPRDGEADPIPVCMVAIESKSGQVIKQRVGEFSPAPPFDIGPRSLFVAYMSTAELSCFDALGWPYPHNILDPYVEYRRKMNGLIGKLGLLYAAEAYGIDAMDSARKAAMQTIAAAGGPWTAETLRELVDYCTDDVRVLVRLVDRMRPEIDLPRALLRGQAMAATRCIERAGIPIDVATLRRLCEHWPNIKSKLIAETDREYGVYDGTVFKMDRFEAYLSQNGIGWPRLDSGALDTKDATFKTMAKAYRQLENLRQLRKTIDGLRPTDLLVGSDNRSRSELWPFGTKTSRYRPGAKTFILLQPKWFRSLIKPERGMSIAYLDFGQQEYLIAAALSGDRAMVESYKSGDVYLDLAKRIGAVPPDASKDSHPDVRAVYKAIVLGMQYCMGPDSLASRADVAPIEAKIIVQRHKETFRDFWRWIDAVVSTALSRSEIATLFGWSMHVRPDAKFKNRGPNLRSLQNFEMQGHGAEMLRLALVMAMERGIRVIAPLHDAVMIEGPTSEIESIAAEMRACMIEASRIVLDCDTPIDVDTAFVHYPDRFVDEKGAEMWATAMRLLEESEANVKAAA
jgi:DNA polymerase I